MQSTPFAITITLILVTIYVIIVQNYATEKKLNNTVKTAIDEQQYQFMVNRAKELTNRYQMLSESLRGQRLDDFSNVTVHKYSTADDARNIIASEHGVTLPHDATQKDMVVGMAQDTDPKNMAVFCKSLRSVSSAAVYIFVNMPVPARHQEIAAATNVTLIPFLLQDVNRAFRSYHPSTLRWILIRNFLKSSETQLVSRFWLIDVRDSYFQGDPFFFVGTKPALHIFNGVESKNINGCGWNSGWIKDCFGTTTLGKVGSNSIICSGVTTGTAQSIRDYVERMFLVITGVDNKLGGKFPQCERNGVDQGVHNVLVHSPGVLSNVFRWSQRDTPVANMQAAVCTIKGNEVFNSKGERVVVVHQYDRYPQLQRYLFSKYVDWVNTDDIHAEWIAEKACSVFTMKEDIDMFKGKCDLKMVGGATSAAACCSKCGSMHACKAFTYLSGTCFFKSCVIPSSRTAKLVGAISAYLEH